MGASDGGCVSDGRAGTSGIRAAASRPRLSRRTLLAAGGLTALGVGLGGCGRGEPRADDRASGTVDGPHQPGVTTPPPASAVFAALDVTASGAAGLSGVLRELERRIPRAVSTGSGNSGAEVTVAFGASLFDGRFGLAGRAPRHLVTMPSFPHDVLEPAQSHGDLLLQICGLEPPRPVLDALLVPGVTLRWSVDGFRGENGRSAAGTPVDRNLFGFRDGAGNPDPADVDDVVWVRPEDDEPSWATGGSYQVVRIIRFATALWDAEPEQAQEAVFGRRKSDGAPLGHQHEDDEFDYRDDPDGRTIALDSHIRRANPRTPNSITERILRRGYSFRRGHDPAGNPDEGMLFICFQRNPERAFATIQRRLAGQRLDKYTLVVGGGYFFVPPTLSAL